MVLCTKVSGKIVNSMDSVSVAGLLAIHMRDITTWALNMLLESLHFQMVLATKVNIIMINSMVMEFIHGQMEIPTTGLLKITKDMG